jgi:hypothetical protein
MRENKQARKEVGSDSDGINLLHSSNLLGSWHHQLGLRNARQKLYPRPGLVSSLSLSLSLNCSLRIAFLPLVAYPLSCLTRARIGLEVESLGVKWVAICCCADEERCCSKESESREMARPEVGTAAQPRESVQSANRGDSSNTSDACIETTNTTAQSEFVRALLTCGLTLLAGPFDQMSSLST